MRLPPVLPSLLLSACVTEPADRAPTVAERRGSPVVECERIAFHAVMHDNQATLYLPGIAISLPRARSASGARYAANGYLLWQKGDDILFRSPDREHRDCRISERYNAWANAWLRGVDFRAWGNEPGWILEISKGRSMALQWDYGKRRLESPVPEAERAQDLYTYRATADDRRLVVEIMDRACRDSMKGDAHDYAVRVQVNGRELLGCGRGLVPVSSAP